MSIRVLVYSNPLVFDNITKAPIVDKDSGFILMKSILQRLPDNWHVTWLVPKYKNMSWFTEGIKNIKLVEYPYSSSIHQSRYEFYGNVIKREFTYSKDVDVILCNQPEISMNLRVLFENQRREKPIIINFYHWLDCEDNAKFAKDLSGFFWRQLDGFLAADWNLFHTVQAVEMFKKEIDMKLKESPRMNVDLFHPPLNRFERKAPFELPAGKKIILFNHRLNNTTNWQLVLKTCDELYKTRQDFVLWFTDENNLKQITDIKSRPFVVVKRLSTEHYAYLLDKAHFSICTHTEYSTWNMAVMDSIINGCPALMPDTRDDFYERMFSNCAQQHILLYPINNLLTTLDFRLTAPRECVKVTQTYLDYIIRDTPKDIYNFVLGEITRRIEDKTPAKYEEVLELIKRKGTCDKSTWVNEFWEFHANSNFQKIRWKLMQDGVRDTLRSDRTVYSVESKTNTSFFED